MKLVLLIPSTSRIHICQTLCGNVKGIQVPSPKQLMVQKKHKQGNKAGLSEEHPTELDTELDLEGQEGLVRERPGRRMKYHWEEGHSLRTVSTGRRENQRAGVVGNKMGGRQGPTERKLGTLGVRSLGFS